MKKTWTKPLLILLALSVIFIFALTRYVHLVFDYEDIKAKLMGDTIQNSLLRYELKQQYQLIQDSQLEKRANACKTRFYQHDIFYRVDFEDNTPLLGSSTDLPWPANVWQDNKDAFWYSITASGYQSLLTISLYMDYKANTCRVYRIYANNPPEAPQTIVLDGTITTLRGL